MTRNRRDFFDIPKKFQINEEQSDWSDFRCDEMKLAFAAYIRWLIDEDKKRVEAELLQKEQESNRPNLAPNMGNPNGLLTMDQMAELLILMQRKGK
jgi:hypothetical protein